MLFRSITLVAMTVAVGCGGPDRHPVPSGLRDAARVPGMPDGIRAWGDQFSPAFQQSVVDSGPQCVRAYGVDGQPTAVLAISGGGSNGAFAAGLVCGWTDHGDRPVFRVVTGISAGAIVAPFAFLGPAYDGQLRRIATQISGEKVFEQKGLLTAFTSDSLADTGPLADFLAGFYDERLIAAVAAEGAKGRRLWVATTDLDAQRPVLWDLTKIAGVGGPPAVALFRRVILASAAIPVVFPPVYLTVTAGGHEYDEMHVDGGVSTEVILYGSVIHVPEIVQQHRAEQGRPGLVPTAYVIRNGKVVPEPKDVDPKLLAIAGQSVGMLTKGQGIGDLYEVYDICRRDHLNFRLAVLPADAASDAGGDPFDPKVIRALFDRGYAMGRGGYPWATEPPELTPGRSAVGQLP